MLAAVIHRHTVPFEPAISDGIQTVRIRAMPFRLLSPAHWPTWLLIAVAFFVVRLPIRYQFRLGRLIGNLFQRIGGRRTRIAAQNIELCFPDLSAQERARLTKQVFESTGIAIIETAYTWLRPVDALLPRVRFHGLEVLQTAVNEGKGVLLVGAHFAVLDLGGAFLAAHFDFDCIYRTSRNSVIDYISLRRRNSLYGHVIERSDMRGTVRQLRQSRTIWYAADQDNGRQHSVFAPFFGIPAATINVTSRLAKISGSPVIFMSHFRDESDCSWSVRLRRVEAYPTGDEIADATLMNRVIEREILSHPAQYLWLHRRFKTMPDGTRKY